VRVAHYVNQFFGGLGGEEAADSPITARAGAIGPALGLKQALGARGEVVVTIVGGDTYVAEHESSAASAIVDMLREHRVDVLVAGPAFNAGRYGLACGVACTAAQRDVGIRAVTAMHPDNPAVDTHRRNVYILPTGTSAADMRRALAALADFAVKLGDAQRIGSAEQEGYLPRGFRRNEHVDRTAAERVIDMLHAKLRGEPYTSEIPNQAFETVPPAPPLEDPKRTLLALVSEAGVVPTGNPDRIRFTSATNWAAYALDVIQPGQVEVVHGGYDASFANADPNRVLPVDALRDLVASGEIGGLLDRYFVTVGNGTPVDTCAAFGAAIAAELKQAGVGGVVLPST
jgi:glycine reductase complex component B subunit gamma